MNIWRNVFVFFTFLVATSSMLAMDRPGPLLFADLVEAYNTEKPLETLFAIAQGNPVEGSIDKVIKQLVAQGADVNDTDERGQSPLTLAIYHADRETVQSLLHHGADTNIGSWYRPKNNEAAHLWGRPLHHAISAQRPDLVAFLLDNGETKCETKLEKRWNKTPLMHAVREGDTHSMHLLLQHGANIQAEDIIQWTPLHYAALGGNNECVEELLKRGANPNARSCGGGNTPLMGAAWSGNPACIRSLVNAGAQWNYVCEMGSPIHYAVENHKPEALRTLLQLDANPNLQDMRAQQNTPLMNVIEEIAEWFHYYSFEESFEEKHRSACLEMLDVLLHYRANPNIANISGVTPLMEIAKKSTHYAELLLDHGAQPSLKDNDGWTALVNALNCGNVKSVELLLGRGAKPEEAEEAKMEDGTSALTYYEKEAGESEEHRQAAQLIRAKHEEGELVPGWLYETADKKDLKQ